MTFGTLKKLIRQLTELYFTGATVRYSEQNFTPKPSSSLVTLTFGSVNRPRDPPMRFIDGHPVSYYPASVPVQIDLFTNGRQEETEPGFTPIVENTAEEDLLSFSSFLNSPYATQWCDHENISIVIPNEVRDLTGLIHDTNYEFRASFEISVYFTMEAIGYTGTLDLSSIKPGEPETIEPESTMTPSGGGNPALVKEESGYFTNVQINDKSVKEDTKI